MRRPQNFDLDMRRMSQQDMQAMEREMYFRRDNSPLPDFRTHRSDIL